MRRRIRSVLPVFAHKVKRPSPYWERKPDALGRAAREWLSGRFQPEPKAVPGMIHLSPWFDTTVDGGGIDDIGDAVDELRP